MQATYEDVVDLRIRRLERRVVGVAVDLAETAVVEQDGRGRPSEATPRPALTATRRYGLASGRSLRVDAPALRMARAGYRIEG